MAWTFTTNQTPATGAIAMYTFKERCKTAGFTIPSSSDGTTYNSSGDQISSGGTGAGGLGNNSAWFRMRDPGGVREWTFQRGTTNLVWRVKYSASAKFSTGSPSATQTPQASDQQLLRGLGGGTDASPTYGSLFATDAGYRFHCGADNAAGYGAYLIAYPIGGWVSGGGISTLVLDPLTNCATEDVEPFAHYVGLTGESSVFSSTHMSSNSTGPQCFLNKGLAGEGFVIVPALMFRGPDGDLAPNGLSSNGHNAKDDELPIPLGRHKNQNAPTGWKGISKTIRMRGILRTTGSTVTISSTKDRIVMNQCSLPWDGITDPLL